MYPITKKQTLFTLAKGTFGRTIKLLLFYKKGIEKSIAIGYPILMLPRILICAGGSNVIHRLERYSFELDTWTTYTPSETGLSTRRFINLITVDNKLYLIGGFDLASSAYTSEIYQLDADSVTVSQVGNLVEPWGHSVLISFYVPNTF